MRARRELAGVADPVQVRAPAKVNLHLAVGPARADGYHGVTTVLQAVSLYDELTATHATETSCTVEGADAGVVPGGDDNLAVRAARRLAELAGISFGVHLHIRKAIPVAAGLGGGSADAAAALVACDALWRVGLEREDLAGLAESLGTDVPFALLGGTALGTGRGDQVTPVLARGRFHWVLCYAEKALSTADVYAEYDRAAPVPLTRPDDVLAALRAGDPLQLALALHNDLQAPAFRLRPGLHRTVEAGRDAGALGAMLCGSGASVALLARSASHAVSLAASLAGAGVCRTVRAVHGPVAGPRVVAAPEPDED
ncbi:MAG: 4-(cytidine 5'-diphospho)-2-C-methyl-D-erythritol kinase [Mycobacteriales bacterium]|nr:4-(cytidine 5'-diphospho)-2-C-methyl-D-erythritol kinase [Frankia sp.]